MRLHSHMTNKDYQRLNHVDPVLADRELRGLVQTGLVEQHSARRWAHYKLHSTVIADMAESALADEETFLAYVREHGSLNNSACRALLGVNAPRALNLLKRMRRCAQLKQVGMSRGIRYVVPKSLSPH